MTDQMIYIILVKPNNQSPVWLIPYEISSCMEELYQTCVESRHCWQLTNSQICFQLNCQTYGLELLQNSLELFRPTSHTTYLKKNFYHSNTIYLQQSKIVLTQIEVAYSQVFYLKKSVEQIELVLSYRYL